MLFGFPKDPVKRKMEVMAHPFIKNISFPLEKCWEIFSVKYEIVWQKNV